MFRRTLIASTLSAFALVVGCAADPGTSGSGGASGFGPAGGSGGFGATGAVGGSGGFGALGGSGGIGAFGGDAGSSANGGAGGFDMTQDGGCQIIEDESPVSRGEVDIIWIIDNSCSMFEEYTNVKNNLNAFANDIFNAGVDHHVITIVGAAVIPFISPAGDPAVGTPLGMDPTRYRYIPQEVGSNNPMDLLLSTYTRWSDFLRPAAPTHIVVVTDDESDMTAAQFKSAMEGPSYLGRPFIYHSIASENPKCPTAANPSDQHYALSDMTGGEKMSICLTDWSPLFARLKDAVVRSVPLPCEFTIPPPPMGATLNEEFVNFNYTPDMGTAMPWPRAMEMAHCGDQIGWYYGPPSPAPPTTIHLCPAGCAAVSGGGKISIVFGCDPPPVLDPPE